MKRRVFALSGLLLAAALGAGGAAQAQDQPLRILVGFPAGGGTDAIARHLAHGLQQELGRNVLVENKPGAGGQIAANALKAAAPDGHTLFFSNSHALAMIPLTIRNPGYDPLKDFAPVALATISNDVMAVNPKVVGNVGNLAGLIEWAKAHPDQVAAQVAPLLNLPLDTAERVVKRQGYGARFISPEVAAQQQKIADAFTALKLIPKPLVIRDVVWTPPASLQTAAAKP